MIKFRYLLTELLTDWIGISDIMGKFIYYLLIRLLLFIIINHF